MLTGHWPMALHLQLQAFRQGFHAGADESGKRRRHAVHQDAQIHAAWRRGFEAGQAAARAGAEAFAVELETAR